MQPIPKTEHHQPETPPLWSKGATIANGNCGYHAFAEIFVRLVRDNPNQVNSEFFNPKNPFFAPARAFLQDSLGLPDNFSAQDLQNVFLETSSRSRGQFRFNSEDIALKVAPIFLLLNVQQHKAVTANAATLPQSAPNILPPLPPTPHHSINSAFFTDSEIDSLPPPPEAQEMLRAFVSGTSYYELQKQYHPNNEAQKKDSLLKQLSNNEFRPLLSYLTAPEQEHDHTKAQECFLTQSFPFVAINDFECLQQLVFKPLISQAPLEEYEEPELIPPQSKRVYPFFIAPEAAIPLFQREPGQLYAMYMPSGPNNHFEYAIHRDILEMNPIIPASEGTTVARQTLKLASANIELPPTSVIRASDQGNQSSLDIILSPQAKAFYDRYLEDRDSAILENDWTPPHLEKDKPYIEIIYETLLTLNQELGSLNKQDLLYNAEIAQLEQKVAICAALVYQNFPHHQSWNTDATIITCNPSAERIETPLEENYDTVSLSARPIDANLYSSLASHGAIPTQLPTPPLSAHQSRTKSVSPFIFNSSNYSEPSLLNPYSTQPFLSSTAVPARAYPSVRRNYYPPAAAAAAHLYDNAHNHNSFEMQPAIPAAQAAAQSAFIPGKKSPAVLSGALHLPRPRALSTDSLESVLSMHSPTQSPTNASGMPFGSDGSSFSTARAPQKPVPVVARKMPAHSAAAAFTGTGSPLKITDLFQELKQKATETPSIYKEHSTKVFHVGSLSVENTSTAATTSLKIQQNQNLNTTSDANSEQQLISKCAACFDKPHVHIAINMASKADIANLLSFIEKTKASPKQMSYSFDLKNSAPGDGHAATKLLINSLQQGGLSCAQITAQIESTLASYPATNKSLTTAAMVNTRSVVGAHDLRTPRH